MPRRSQEAESIHAAEFEDELGQWVRLGLQESVGRHGPGEEVWARILKRVQHNDLPPASDWMPRGPSSPLAQLLQAVVVSTLLLTFAFGANHGPVMPRHTEHVAATTPLVRRAAAPLRSEEDILRGYILVRMEKESLAQRGGDARGTRVPE